MMESVFYVIPLLLLIAWFVARLLLRIIFNAVSKKLLKLAQLKLAVDKIRFTEVQNLSIEKDNLFKIHIDNISITTKWFNSACSKPFGVIIGTVTIDLLNRPKTESSAIKEKEKGSSKTSNAVINIVKFIMQQLCIIVNNVIISKKVEDLSIVWSSEIKVQVVLNASSKTDVLINLNGCKMTALLDDYPVVFASHSLDIKTTFDNTFSIDNMVCDINLKTFHIDINEDLILYLIKSKKSCSTEDEPIAAVNTNIENKKSTSKTMLTKLPHQIKLSLNNIKIKYKMKSERELQFDWNCILAWQRIDYENYEASLDVIGFVVNGTNHCKLLLCKQMTSYVNVTIKEEMKLLKIVNKFDSCHFDCIYSEIKFWRDYIKSVQKNLKNTKNEQVLPNPSAEPSARNIIVDMDVQLENCSCDLFMLLEKSYGSSKLLFNSRLISIALKNGNLMEKSCKLDILVNDVYIYVNTEDILEDSNLTTHLPCQLEHDQPPCVPSSHKHAWGRVFELGKLQFDCTIDQTQSLDGILDVEYLTFEWSLAMGNSLLYFAEQLVSYSKQDIGTKSESKKMIEGPAHDQVSFLNKVSLATTTKNINVIALGNKDGGYNSLLLKLDETNTTACLNLNDHKLSVVDVEVKGLVVAQLIELLHLKIGDSFYCQESSKYINSIVKVDIIIVNAKSFSNYAINVENVCVDWTSNKHMALYDQLTDCQSFMKTTKEFTSQLRSNKSNEASKSGSSKPQQLDIKIDVNMFILKAITAKDHSFGIESNSLYFNITATERLIQIQSLTILFDEREIIQFEDIRVKNLSENSLASIRSQYKSLSLTNSAWEISIKNCYILFPYKFDFAEPMQKVQIAFKMLKYLHKKPKPKNYIESLPPDFSLIVENLLIEFEDDPFEVKLGDNYMLLFDEIEQANEREGKLEMKLNQIKSEKGAMLSGKKIDDLRRNLKEKNAQIYIDRSKEMYEDREPRKALFTIMLKSLQLTVLADQSTHGEANILRHMNVVNPESPIPDDIAFTTLWARTTNGHFDILKVVIRDFPQPLVFMEGFSMRGMVLGSEAIGDEKSKVEYCIHIGDPWKDLNVVKNMSPLKFYYDLKWDMSTCQMAWGANYEPTFAMVSQAFELLTKPSIDKSPILPFFDKIRLLLHGNLKADIADLNVILNASTDPYNTTEKLEIEWSAVTLEWTNRKIEIDGDFDLYTRTASKYDDSKVMHFPSLKLIVELEWICNGEGNNHHVIYPTNPNFIHLIENEDSYSNFRSTNVNMNVIIESSMEQTKSRLLEDPPSVFLYANTFRWFQIYQAVNITRVSRPIKRGLLFNNVKPKKIAIGRHYKLVNVDFKFPCLNLTYWGSFQQDSGFEANISAGQLSISYQVFISPHPDSINLIRRPVANWIIRGLNSTFENSNLFLLESCKANHKEEEAEENTEDDLLCIHEEGELRKHYLFSVQRMEYQRQHIEEMFTHKLLLHDFKGAWTAINRELVFELLEAYSKMTTLKKVLSSEALKLTSDVTNSEVKKDKAHSSASLLDHSANKSPLTRMQSGHAVSLLQQLVSEQSSKFIAQAEEGDSSELDVSANMDGSEETDIIQKNWHIEFVNSQVLLHGTETKGAIIVTSETATILKCLHRPVLESAIKLNKASWCGKFQNLQYFSTVQNFKDISVDNIPWLTKSIIVCPPKSHGKSEENGNELDMYTRVSDAVGVFIDITVQNETYQLQRVIARCELEFHYVNFDDEIDPLADEYTPIALKDSEETLSQRTSFATKLRLKHGKFSMSTSHSQYAVILDICQNLIFYTAPKQKEVQERREKMRFKLQLSTGQDLKGKVSQLQTRVRSTQELLRFYERRLFEYKKEEEGLIDSSETLDEIKDIMIDLEDQIEVTKEQLFDDVEELKILINAYKDVEQLTTINPSPQKGGASIIKEIDVVFNDMEWLLTREDGQLGISKVLIKRFRYNNLSFKDNCCEHRFEVGHFQLNNLLPNEPYREALIPHEINIRRHLDKTVMLRIYCRISPAVAGILVKDHFEVNVCPIAVRLTHKFNNNMESFFFPKKTENEVVENSEQTTEIQLGIRAAPDIPYTAKESSTSESNKSKVPPPRPPPPKMTPSAATQKSALRSSVRRKASSTSVDGTTESVVSVKTTKKSHRNSMEISISPPPLSPGITNQPVVKSATLSRNKSHVSTATFSYADRDINTMKERASKNQQFIYIKIPEIPVCFSYKGEKERNIADASDFNLCLPTLEYHGKMWTWQDLFQALKKDYIQVLVPQILKEKLHLKSSGADTKPSIAQVDDTNKARLLFGEKQTSSHKKSAKKILFGKLLKSSSRSHSSEKLNEATSSNASSSPSTSSLLPSSKSSNTSLYDSNNSQQQEDIGKGVDPSTLGNQFNRLRGLGNEKK